VFNQATLAPVQEAKYMIRAWLKFTRGEAINRTTRQKLETLP
jgi:hypothetical protein